MLVPVLGIAVTAYILLDVPVSAATEFGCKDTLISDKWREAVLNFHNSNRKRISQGLQLSKNGKVMPGAKDMNQLYWDCNIEYNAYLLNCGDPSAKVPTDYGDISASINLGGKCEDPYDQTLPILQNWWNQVKLEELSTPDINPATQNNFGMMANGPTTGFACTYNKKCSGKLLCLYNTQPSKNQNANELYTAANPPNTPICACPGCTSYLCPSSPYEPSKITYPQTSCATKDDPEDGITSFMQTMAQDMVNYYRRLVGSGWAPDRSGYALPAKKMTAVKYDCTIGDLTKDLADACTAPNTASPGYSVSYYEERDLTKTPMEVLSTAIKKWAEQSKLVDLGETVTFSGDVEAKAPDFAKMVNEAATKVVCSVTKDECLKQGIRVAVCQYDSIITTGDPVYTTGKACSGCKALGLKCDNDLGGGLCVNP